MLRHFANLFRGEVAAQKERVAAAQPAPNESPEPSETGRTSNETKDALKRFMRLVTAHLVVSEGRRLTDAVLGAFDADGDAAAAFDEGVLGDEGQQRGQWLVIQCDWKAHEELEWQVTEVAASLGIQEQWRWASPEPTTRIVPNGLVEVANWAASLGYELLNIDLGGDSYYALLVRSGDAESACQAAEEAGLDVLRAAEFAESNAG